jgi:hypothetical protein
MNPPLMQNSHDHGSSAALQLLFTAFCTWELMYRFFRFALKHMLTNHPDLILIESTFNDDCLNGVITNGKQTNDPATTKKLQEIKHNLIDRGPSYATSQIHAIYASSRGILHLYNLQSVSNLDKLLIPSQHMINNVTTTPRWMHLQVATTNTIFLSYLMYDLLHVSLQYPKLGGVDTILHHVLFAICSVINGTYGIMAYPFGWLVVGEISTIFLNWRWFLLKSGREEGVWIKLVNGLFAFSFFVTRNVIYSCGMVHLLWFSLEEVKSLPEASGVPLGWFSMTVGCMFLGWALNFVWGWKILNMMISGRSGEGKKRKKQ